MIENISEDTMLSCESITWAGYAEGLVSRMSNWFVAALYETLRDRTTVRERLQSGPVKLSARLRGENIVIKDETDEFAVWEAVARRQMKPRQVTIETRLMALSEEPSPALMDQFKHQLHARRVFFSNGYLCAELEISGAAAEAIGEARSFAYSVSASCVPLAEGSSISGGVAPPPTTSKPAVVAHGQGVPPRPVIPCNLKPLYIVEGATTPQRSRGDV